MLQLEVIVYTGVSPTVTCALIASMGGVLRHMIKWTAFIRNRGRSSGNAISQHLKGVLACTAASNKHSKVAMN